MNDVDPNSFYWYTLRTLMEEEKCISFLRGHISLSKLKDRIVDMKFFREFRIVESNEYESDSDLLPKRGFASTKASSWVKLSNGNYKRIRLVEKRPFKGMIFIKMAYDINLFKLIRSWDAGFNFLGSPTPSPMTDFQLRKTEDSIPKEVPSIADYITEKGYLLVEGKVSKFRGVKVDAKETPASSEEIEVSLKQPEPTPATEVPDGEVVTPSGDVDKKSEIYSDLNIKEYEDIFDSIKFKKSSGKGEGFSVNDFVFIKHLGFKGVIQEIDYDKDFVVVGVQMFGRRQPVECKISEISEI